MQDSLLKDRYNRVHNYLRISLTERCNLKCFYCMPADYVPGSGEDYMNAEEVLGIARQFVEYGITKIRLTGGEPMIHKDFKQIVTGLGQLPVSLHITSNGILVDCYLDDLVAAGIKEINISLDSLSRERFEKITGRDYFNRVINNLDLLSKSGIRTKLNVVVVKGVNDHEIIDFIGLTQDKNLDVRFIEFMPFKGNNWKWSKGVSHDDILAKVNGVYGNAVDPLEHNPHETARNYQVEGYSGTFGVISSVTKPFCGDCNRIRLTANGKIKNCLFSRTEESLLDAFRRGEPLFPVIERSLASKHERSGGKDFHLHSKSFEEEGVMRSMVTIGG